LFTFKVAAAELDAQVAMCLWPDLLSLRCFMFSVKSLSIYCPALLLATL